MALAFAPKIDYNNGAAQSVSLLFSMGLWTPSSIGVGGSDVAGSGIPESFEIRRDQLCKIKLRFFESEWPAVEQWLSWAQSSGQSFTFQFDQTDSSTAHTVYLHAPKMGDDPVEPDRSDYRKMFEINITLRRTTNTRFDVRL